MAANQDAIANKEKRLQETKSQCIATTFRV